jgi:hypothetical protein
VKEENRIIQYNAADIERYHKGLMNAGEMHALEKAALDDPFLADALDGYNVPDLNMAAELNELNNRLNERTGQVKIMASGKKSPFFFLRIAAILVVMAGAGLLTYTFFNKNKDENALVKNETAQKATEKTNSADTGKSLNNIVPFDSVAGRLSALSSDKKTVLTNSEKEKIDLSAGSHSDVGYYKPDSGKINLPAANTSRNTGEVSSAPSAPTTVINNVDLKKDVAAKEKQKSDDLEDSFKKDKAAKSEELKLNEVVVASKSKNPVSKRADEKTQIDRQQRPENTDLNLKSIAESKDSINYSRLNIFRGKVTDASDNGIPFANITITDVNVGTYADAKGNFSLVAPDSTLSVNLRAVGFNNSQVQLRNSLPTNQVILEEDNSLHAIVINPNKPNSSRSRSSTMILTEPEPSDGWENYDSYLANNLKVPEEKLRLQKKGAVEVSFDVNSKGEPVNITITKSLCKECDEEAIRLIKEGPRWNRKNKKQKARVTVSF